MSKKAKILLILGVAVGLTLVTLLMFFPKQFVTVVLWVVGTIVVVFFLYALSKGGALGIPKGDYLLTTTL